MAAATWETEFETAQVQRTANVVCMKWGERYPAYWVNRLFAMVMRNTSWNIRFVCFTDDAEGIRPEVECQPMPEVAFDKKLGKYWPKLGLMSEGLGGLQGMTLFLDLDIVIIDKIDDFFSLPGRFCIIQEWKDRELGYGNSSIVRYFIGHESYVLERFYETPADVIMEKYDSKEQNFLTKAVKEVTFWPDEWVVPFSKACLSSNRIVRFFAQPKAPEEGKIVVFYGSITPDSALRGEHQRNKRVGDRFSHPPDAAALPSGELDRRLLARMIPVTKREDLVPELAQKLVFEADEKAMSLAEETTWLGGGQRFVACVFYTEGYLNRVKRLKTSLDSFGINYHFKQVPRRTTWEATTRLKARFVADCLEQFPQLDVLYLDADAIVRQKPDFLESIEGDVGLLFTPTTSRNGKRSLTIAAGTLYIRNTPGGRRFAEAWCLQEQRVGPLGLDEDMIYQAFGEFDGISFTALPRAYSKIFDSAGPAPVIEHFQASRGQFKLSKLMRRGRRAAPIVGIAGAVILGLILIGRMLFA